MAITFHLQSDSLTPKRALGDNTPTLIYDAAAGATAPAIVNDATSGIINGTLIECKHATLTRGLQFATGKNFPATGPLTFRVRFVPRFTGAPGANAMLVALEADAWNSYAVWFYLDTAGKLSWVLKDRYGKTYINIQSAYLLPTLVSGVPCEVMGVWDGTAGANSVQFSENGVSLSQHTATAAAATWDPNSWALIGIGIGQRFPISNVDFNEVVIYNTAETYTYTPSTSAFVTDTAYSGARAYSRGRVINAG